MTPSENRRRVALAQAEPTPKVGRPPGGNLKDTRVLRTFVDGEGNRWSTNSGWPVDVIEQARAERIAQHGARKRRSYPVAA